MNFWELSFKICIRFMQSHHLRLLATLCVQHLLPSILSRDSPPGMEEVGEFSNPLARWASAKYEGNFETYLWVGCSGAAKACFVLFSHEIVRERGTWETLLDIDQQVMRVPFSMHQLRCCHCHQDDYPPSLLGRVAVVAWERAGKSLASL